MSQLRLNTLANLLGRIWDRVIVLVCVPFYLYFLGIEAFGLVGFYTTLVGVFIILDLGFGKTMNREMARLSAQLNTTQEQHDLLRTLEVIYWGLALGAGLIIISLASLIATNWVNSHLLSDETVANAIRLMGLALLLQFPSGLYYGGLRGLQKQVLLNVIIIAVGTLRGAGSVVGLWLVAPTIQVFFSWQLIVNALATGTAAWCLWRSLPIIHTKAKFSKDLLLGVWRFTAAMSANSILIVLLVQMDKIILSKLLTLETFGYYMLASSVATCLYSINYPVNQAVFPQMVQFFELNNEKSLTQLYHRVSQFISVAILPVALVIMFFSQELLWLWTRSPDIAENTALILSLLVTGTMFSAMADMPINLLVARGWPHLVLFSRVAIAFLQVPGIIIMANLYGPSGAALAWAIFNLLYLLTNVIILRFFLLQREQWRWCFEDVGLPLIGALGFVILGRLMLPVSNSWLSLFIFIMSIYIMAVGCASLLSPQVRAVALEYFWRYRKVYSG